MNTKTQAVASTTELLLNDLIGQFLLEPSVLRIKSRVGATAITVQIVTHAADIKRVIGGGGFTFRSLESLTNSIGAKHGISFELQPMPPPGGEKRRHKDFVASESWPKERIAALLARTVKAVVEHESAVVIGAEDSPGVTHFTVRIGRNESQAMVRAMTLGMVKPGDTAQTGWLKVLFNVIGKANHRTVFVEVVADQETETEKQPTSAAGRYASACWNDGPRAG